MAVKGGIKKSINKYIRKQASYLWKPTLNVSEITVIILKTTYKTCLVIFFPYFSRNTDGLSHSKGVNSEGNVGVPSCQRKTLGEHHGKIAVASVAFATAGSQLRGLEAGGGAAGSRPCKGGASWLTHSPLSFVRGTSAFQPVELGARSSESYGDQIYMYQVCQVSKCPEARSTLCAW